VLCPGEEEEMHTVMVQKTIGVSAVEAWKALDDFGGVEKYHPLVERSPLKGEQRSGEGAMRTCHFHGGGSIEEKITGYEEGVGPNRSGPDGTSEVVEATA
jgi:hypothetical protein